MASNEKDDWHDVPVEPRVPAVHDDWQDVPTTPPATPTTKPGIYDRLMEFAARGARIPGGGKTLRAAQSAMNDLTNATTTAGTDMMARLLTGNRHPVPPEYYQGKPKPMSEILQKEYGWSPWAAMPTELVAGGYVDPSGMMTAEAKPISAAMDKMSKDIYQTGFRNVTREFPQFKQHAMSDAGEKFIEYLRQNKVLDSGSDARSVEKQLRGWQRNTLGGAMDEFEKGVKDKTFTNIGEVVAPYTDLKQKLTQDAGPEAILQSFEDKLLNPELAKISEKGGFTLDDLRRKARFYSGMASGKKGANGDIYKQFARESEGKQAAASVAQGMRDFARKETLAANPEDMKDAINQTYSLYGNTETAMPALRKMAKIEDGKKSVTAMDAALGTFGALSHFMPMTGDKGLALAMATLAAKKGADYIQRPAGATRVGNALRDASEYGIWDKMLKRGLMQATDEER